MGCKRPASGGIEVLGHDVLRAGDAETATAGPALRRAFQDGALFSSLT